MRTLLILGLAGVVAGAVALTTLTTVTRARPALKAKPVPTKEAPRNNAAAGAIVASLHPHLAERFGTIPTDQRFGIERAPEQYHIHDGVINPIAAQTEEKKQKAEVGRKFKPYGPDQYPTSEETTLITRLRDSGYDLQVFTVGRKEQDYTRVRGPVGALDNWPGDQIMAEVEAVGGQANDPTHPETVTVASKDGKAQFQAISIRLNKERCQKCHEGVKVGEKVGSIVYRYWPRA